VIYADALRRKGDLQLGSDSTRSVFTAAGDSNRDAVMNTVICDAIRKKAVLAFQYKGSLRQVEPQCHGISSVGNEVLRAVEVGGGSGSSDPIGKLFDVSKMSALAETGKYFTGPAPNHNPADKAMTLVHCCLPRPRAARKQSR